MSSSSKWFATIGDCTSEVVLGPDGVTVGGVEMQASLEAFGQEGDMVLRLGDRSVRLNARRVADGWRISIAGRTHLVQVQDERRREIERLGRTGPAAPRETALRAPMPGMIVKINVEIGQEVSVGTPLLVMEAMKMENELTAQSQGTVAAVDVAEGATVSMNDVLVRFE